MFLLMCTFYDHVYLFLFFFFYLLLFVWFVRFFVVWPGLVYALCVVCWLLLWLKLDVVWLFLPCFFVRVCLLLVCLCVFVCLFLVLCSFRSLCLCFSFGISSCVSKVLLREYVALYLLLNVLFAWMFVCVCLLFVRLFVIVFFVFVFAQLVSVCVLLWAVPFCGRLLCCFVVVCVLC